MIKPKVLAVGAVLALAVAYLVLTGLQTTTVYYLTVGELLQRGPSGQAVRVAGVVAPGSIVKEQGGLGLRFSVKDSSGTYSDYTTSIAVNNVPPTVNPGGPYSATVGTAISRQMRWA